MRDALSRIRKPMKKMIKSDWFRRFLAGLIVGIGWILPGVSGGVIAVSLGIYSKMIDAVGSFLQAKKKNFLYLLPIGIGGCIGLFLVSNVLQWLMAEWYNDVVYFFIGLVIGGIPTLLREANSPQGFKKQYLIFFAIGLSIIVLLFASEATGATNVDSLQQLQPWHAILSGAILSIGTIIPGISTSFILLILGLYEPMLTALNSLNIPLLIYAAIGFAAMSLLSIKSIQLLFKRFPGYSYYCVLGFLVGSTFLAFPTPSWDAGLLIGVLLFAAGVFISLKMSKAPQKTGE